MIIYNLTLADAFKQQLKQPYDVETHKALFFIMQKSKERYIKSIDRCLITDRDIYVAFKETTTFAEGVGIISFITAELTFSFGKKVRIEASLISEDWLIAEELLRKKSRAMYEVCLENNHDITEPSLFGSKHSYALPYEKTPEFFREGVYI